MMGVALRGLQPATATVAAITLLSLVVAQFAFAGELESLDMWPSTTKQVESDRGQPAAVLPTGFSVAGSNGYRVLCLRLTIAT